MGPPSLKDSEELCLEIRKGEIDLSLIGHYLDRVKGLKRFLGGGSANKPLPNELLAASEALLMVGEHGKAILPLQELVLIEGLDQGLKEVALCRAGLISMEHGIPLDLRPIVAELGLEVSRKAGPSRDRTGLPRIEADLLSSSILMDRAGYTESQNEVKGLIDKALYHLRDALSISAKLEGENGRYHHSRCLLAEGGSMLLTGDYVEGTRALEAALEGSTAGGFLLIQADCSLVLAPFIEERTRAIEVLHGASSIGEGLGNFYITSESQYLKGSIMCSTGSGPAAIVEGAHTMLQGSKTIGEVDPERAAQMAVRASVWLVRANEWRQALSMIKEAYRTISRTGDDAEGSLAYATSVYAHIIAGDKQRAKRGLLDLIHRYPVKQFPEAFGVLKEAVGKAPWMREDKDTRELFADAPVYTIERGAVKEIMARAKEAYPNEFGAMLRGLYNITHIEPVFDGAKGRSTFMFSMFDRFSQRDVQGEGVVHSHPSGSAMPSKADLSMFRRFPGINIIIGYPFTEESVAAYDRLGNRVELKIVDKGRG